MPLHCDGASGIQKLDLKTTDALVGFAGGRVFLRSASTCESALLDGTDRKPCPSPDAATIANVLLGQDGEYLYFQGDDVLFRARIADGSAKVLHRGKANAKLVGDALVWSADDELWSMPKAGGTAKKLVSITDGSIADFAASGAELITAGQGGLRLIADGAPKLVALPGDDHADVDAVALTAKSIAFRQADTFWTMDRASGDATRAWKAPDHVTAHGFAVERDGQVILTYVDDARGSKPIYAFARLVNDKPQALIDGNHRVADVVHHDGVVTWSVEDGPAIRQYFSVPEAQFGKQTIHCTDQPLGLPIAPDDAGTPSADASPGPPPPVKPSADASAPAPAAGDDDDVETSSDPTEPASEDEGDGEHDHPTTVKINSACASVPGASGSSFGLVIALGALALRRRRRR